MIKTKVLCHLMATRVCLCPVEVGCEKLLPRSSGCSNRFDTDQSPWHLTGLQIGQELQYNQWDVHAVLWFALLWLYNQLPVCMHVRYLPIALRVASLAPGQSYDMMTSSNENIFRVTGPLCGQFTGHRWITLTKASDTELCCFLWSAHE